jgi:hypothetical protein
VWERDDDHSGNQPIDAGCCFKVRDQPQHSMPIGWAHDKPVNKRDAAIVGEMCKADPPEAASCLVGSFSSPCQYASAFLKHELLRTKMPHTGWHALAMRL